MCIRDRLSTVDSCSASPSAHRQLGLPQRRRWVTTEPRTSRGSPADSGSAITHTSDLTVVNCQIMAHNDAIFLDLQGVSRQQSVPGRATCPRDRSHQDAPSDVTPEEPHPKYFACHGPLPRPRLTGGSRLRRVALQRMKTKSSTVDEC